MEMAKEQELILVIDYGSQYNQLITRRIRELGVYSELHNPSITIEEIKELELSKMTPIDALNTLFGIQDKIKNRW